MPVSKVSLVVEDILEARQLPQEGVPQLFLAQNLKTYLIENLLV
jgi:hypothetical protein